MRQAQLQNSGWPLAVALAWLWIWRHLSVEWGANPQYQYGFAVPFLFLYVVWQRWNGPAQPQRRELLLPVLILAWLALVLGELLRRQDPIWRLTAGLLVSGSALLTAAWFLRWGGTALLRREWFSLMFAFFALPWPAPIELALTQKLLDLVTSVLSAK